MEIEKKYLTTNIPFDLDKFSKTEIQQSYISTDPVIRIRKSDENYFLTFKGSGEISREEFETLITKNQYENLLKTAETKVISKTRYFIPLNDGLTAETDIYYGELKGLITTEVEFKTQTECDSFVAPSWFGKDISSDNRYKNSSLSRFGLPK